MSLLTTGSGSAILRPEDVQALVIQPLIASSVAMLVSTVVPTNSSSTRFPVIESDPTNHWTGEGQEIQVSDPVITEIDCVMKGLKGLSVVSNELLADSSPAALQVVGDGLVRDLRVKLDAAFLGNMIANGPSGLESLDDVQETSRSFDGSLDVIAEAISLSESAGAPTINPADQRPNFSLIANPVDLLTLSTAKVATDSRLPILGQDATQVTGRSALGVPIFSAPACTQGVAWLIPRDRTFVVLRDDPEVIADSSAGFSSFRTFIRAVLRTNFAFPHQASVVRVIIDGGS